MPQICSLGINLTSPSRERVAFEVKVVKTSLAKKITSPISATINQASFIFLSITTSDDFQHQVAFFFFLAPWKRNNNELKRLYIPERLASVHAAPLCSPVVLCVRWETLTER